MKFESVRHDVCAAGESSKSGRKRDGRNNSEGVWRRLGLPKPLAKHRHGGMSLFNYVVRRVGGKAEFLKLARLSTDESVVALVRLWDRLSKSDQRYVALDNLCEACGVAPEQFYGAVVAAAYANGLDVSVLVVATFDYLKILETCIEGAFKAAGSKNREKLITRFLERPRP